MTVATREASTHDAAPLEFYKFVRGARRWLYTSDAAPVTTADGVYLPASIERSDPALGKEERHSTLTLDVVRDFPIAMLFRGGSPGSSIWLSVGCQHRGETDTEWLWQGKVRGVAWTGSRAKLQCDPMDKALGRASLRYTFGCACGHRLFSTRCGVSEAAWTFDTVLASISGDGLTITSPFFATQPDGWWVLGEVYHPALDVRQDIVAHAGNAVTLRLPFPGAAVADAIKVIRGCDHLWKRSDGSWGDCHLVYGNAINFGGDPFIPAKNPFASGLDG